MAKTSGSLAAVLGILLAAARAHAWGGAAFAVAPAPPVTATPLDWARRTCDAVMNRNPNWIARPLSENS